MIQSLKKFRNAPIRSKLIWIYLVVTSVTLIITTTGYVAFQIVSARNSLLQNLVSVAEITAINTSAPLVFRDTDAALQNFESVIGLDHVTDLAVIDANGAFFANIGDLSGAFDSAEEFVTVRGEDGALKYSYRYDANGLVLLTPISLDGSKIGDLAIRSNLDLVYEQFYYLMFLGVAILLVSMIVAYFMILKLQELISSPLVSFKDVVDSVRHTGDFSVRVKQESRDEIGQLIQGFNEMLAEIKLRDDSLKNYQNNLEITVSERTQDVKKINKTLKSALNEANRERDRAEEANKTKSEFLAMMSHEIRTPMNGILGMTALLSGTEMTPEQRHYAQTAHESGEILLALINDVLDYSKIEAGKMSPDNSRFDLEEMISRTCGLFTSQFRAKNLSFSLDIDPALTTMLIGDSNKWRQVLINFVGNALKFTRQGGITVRVQVLDQDSQHARILLAVRDTGIGIPASKQQAIFDPFSQADASTTKEFGGSGLGLTISKRLVEMMGGKIGVNSNDGEGSEFWISINLKKAKALTSKMGAIGELLQHENVLILTDSNHDPLIKKAMKLPKVKSVFLEEGAAFDAKLRTVGQKILAQEEDLSFVFIDTHLPLDENIRLASKIRDTTRNPVLPIIFVLEGITCDQDFQGSLSSHYYTLLKPLNEIDFQMSVTQILSKEMSVRPRAAHGAELSKALGMRLLLAEDNIVNQQVATAMIKKLGCEVVIASNGREAVDLFMQDEFDMIFMDCQMPILDGYQATGEIRELEALEKGIGRIPIVALTANAVSGDRAKALESGMDDYLSKPYSEDQLYEMIKQIGLMSTRRKHETLSSSASYSVEQVDLVSDSLV